MIRKRATLADIARQLDISIMTVSRAVNNKPGVSPALREKVLAAAEEMGFHPNQIARSLATSQTATIGLVVPDISNPFFSQIARGVEDVAYENNFTIFLLNTAEDLARERAALDALWSQGIDGAILCSLRTPAARLREEAQRFPAAVLVNRELSKPVPGVVSINVNDQRGGYEAVQHLCATGRKHIAYAAGPAGSISAQRRLSGYRLALEAAGMAYDPGLVEHCSPDTAGGQAAATALLARRPEIDAIYAYNDLAAVGVLQAAQDAGRAVPDSLAIIGADDIPLATMVRPQLSTLRVDQGYLGRLAMRTLLDIIGGESSPASFQVEPELVVRAST